MWDSLQHLSYWNWLAVGTLLLILEVFGAGGYLLWIGLAAASVGVLTFLFPELPWALQFILFGVLSVLTAVLWWRRQRSAAKPSDQPGLNRRQQANRDKVLKIVTTGQWHCLLKAQLKQHWLSSPSGTVDDTIHSHLRPRPETRTPPTTGPRAIA